MKPRINFSLAVFIIILCFFMTACVAEKTTTPSPQVSISLSTLGNTQVAPTTTDSRVSTDIPKLPYLYLSISTIHVPFERRFARWDANCLITGELCPEIELISTQNEELDSDAVLTWSPGGTVAVWVNTLTGVVSLLDPGTGKFQKLLDGYILSQQPVIWSKDSQYFFGVDNSVAAYTAVISKVDIKTGEVEYVSVGDLRIPQLLGWSDESHLLFMLDQSGSIPGAGASKMDVTARYLCQLDVRNNEISEITTDADWLHSQGERLSPNGQEIALCLNNALSFFSLSSNTIKNTGVACGMLEWSPDSQQLAIIREANVSIVSQYQEIFSKSIPSQFVMFVLWTPDSKRILVFPGQYLNPQKPEEGQYMFYLIDSNKALEERSIPGLSRSEWDVFRGNFRNHAQE